MNTISPKNKMIIDNIFSSSKAVIGVVHCPAFPGAPRYQGASIDSIYDACMRDAEAYIEGGMHGLIIENHGDIPFSKPEDITHETVGFLSVITDRIKRAIDTPLGINVLANAPIAALAAACASSAQFIRVNQWANAYVANEGFMEGRAGEAMRYRSQLRAENIAIFADSHVKHGAHAIVADRTIEEQTRDIEFFDADAIIATGQRTGNTATTEEIVQIGDATSLPILVGSGVTTENIEHILGLTSGVIVASSVKEGGVWWNPVDKQRVVELMRASKLI